MSKPPNDFWKDIYGTKTYIIRGRRFKGKSFDIIDSFERYILYAKPRRIISSATGIYSIKEGNPELVYFKDISSAKDAYNRKLATCEFRDAITNEIIGMLRTEKLGSQDQKIFILDPLMQTIGDIEKRSTPGVRIGNKPLVDIYTGSIDSHHVFELKVNLKSSRFEMHADFAMDEQEIFDRRFGLSIAVFFAGVARTHTSD